MYIHNIYKYIFDEGRKALTGCTTTSQIWPGSKAAFTVSEIKLKT